MFAAFLSALIYSHGGFLFVSILVIAFQKNKVWLGASSNVELHMRRIKRSELSL